MLAQQHGVKVGWDYYPTEKQKSVITNQHRKEKTMRITSINQQMNTNRMNQNVSVNRSNATNMQNPSFGTKVTPDTLEKIVIFLKDCSSEFVKKHATGLDIKLEKLAKDEHPDDVIELVSHSHRTEHCANWDSQDWQTEYYDVLSPRLTINHPKHGKISTPINTGNGEPKNISTFGDFIAPDSFNDYRLHNFGNFLDGLTPEKVEPRRIKFIDEFEKQEVIRLENEAKAAEEARKAVVVLEQQKQDENLKASTIAGLEALLSKAE